MGCGCGGAPAPVSLAPGATLAMPSTLNAGYQQIVDSGAQSLPPVTIVAKRPFPWWLLVVGALLLMGRRK